MIDFFADTFSNCVVVAVLLMAMLPMVESKVAIPFALSASVLGDAVLSPTMAYFVAFLGCMMPCIFVILFARWLKSKTSGFVHEKVMTRYAARLAKLTSKESIFKKCITLATFVAVPLPLTGAWTGSLIAGLSSLKIWQSFLSVMVGELVSCAVVLLLCLVLENSAFYIFLLSLAIIALFVVVNLLLWLVEKIKNRRKNREIEIKCL